MVKGAIRNKRVGIEVGASESEMGTRSRRFEV